MAKRFTDTDIWKKQRWFKKLSPHYKLAFLYIKDQCDHAGFWKIDFAELVDDIGLEEFNLHDFVKSCNKDFDKQTGKPVAKERVKLLENGSYIWLTGFMKFQYESKEFIIPVNMPVVRSAMELLASHKTLIEGLQKGYITLPEPLRKSIGTVKDKDKDKDIYNTIYSKDSNTTVSKESYYRKNAKPESIMVDGQEHKPKMNGSGWVYPTIKGVQFDKDFTKVKLSDGTWQNLTQMQTNQAKAGKLKPEIIYKGKTK